MTGTHCTCIRCTDKQGKSRHIASVPWSVVLTGTVRRCPDTPDTQLYLQCKSCGTWHRYKVIAPVLTEHAA